MRLFPFVSGAHSCDTKAPLRTMTADQQDRRRDTEVLDRYRQQEGAETGADPADGGGETGADTADLGREHLSRVDARQRPVHRVEEREDEEQAQHDQRRRTRPQADDQEDDGARSTAAGP